MNRHPTFSWIGCAFLTVAGSALAQGTPPDACTVASVEEITATFGAGYKIAPGSPHVNGTVSRCDWKAGKSFLMVRTEAIDKASFEASMKNVPGGTKTIQGVGESAYFQPSTNQYFMYKGKTKVSLNFAGGSAKQEEIEANETALLKKIATKI